MTPSFWNKTVFLCAGLATSVSLVLMLVAIHTSILPSSAANFLLVGTAVLGWTTWLLLPRVAPNGQETLQRWFSKHQNTLMSSAFLIGLIWFTCTMMGITTWILTPITLMLTGGMIRFAHHVEKKNQKSESPTAPKP